MCDDTPVSIAQLVRSLAAGMGRAPRLFALPPKLLRAAARLSGREDAARRLIGSLEADGGKLARALGWRPPIPAEQGLRETAAWFRSESRARGSD